MSPILVGELKPSTNDSTARFGSFRDCCCAYTGFGSQGMIVAVKIINATIAIEDPGINLDNELTCLHSLPRFVFSLSY
jgi:hypothetical protein